MLFIICNIDGKLYIGGNDKYRVKIFKSWYIFGWFNFYFFRDKVYFFFYNIFFGFF